ncbi:outer membrane protein [Acinetobacter baylyi]|uniref:Outer membrane protein n=1 Tax=Acinetobacter baylyi TaxID=202950 RepID=A0ABU0UXA5_ACIBI|nr:TolC family protein [Acinetobacter baylyi]MDQ1209194.1 outer membrane protein [Acinetobacter baylyi]MDR6107214.1 outer membrane protein [Acinetobacter baylyi]MDR6186064.1 outer membrane protein [Acinetobacter baylyi]
MKQLHWFSLVGLLVSPALWGMTLDEAVQHALTYEPQLKINDLQVGRAEAELQQAQHRYGLNVSVEGQLGVGQINNPPTYSPLFSIDERFRNTRSLMLKFDYPLYTAGRERIGIEMAHMQVAAQSQAFTNQQSATVLQTVQAYTDVLRQQAVLKLKNKVQANLQQSLSDAQKRLNAGVITRADLAQIQAQLAQSQADSVRAESQLSISQTRFYQLTGLTAQVLDTPQDLPAIPGNVDDVIYAIEQHPSLQQARFEQQVAEKQYRLSKLELRPSIGLTGRVGTQHEIKDGESKGYLVGLKVDVPIYDNGLNKANRQKANVELELATQKINALQQALTQQAQATYFQIQAVRQNKRALEQAINAASIALQFMKREQEFGTKTTTDVLNAEQSLLDVQTQKISNQQDEVVLTYQLLDQMGRLSALFPINTHDSALKP